MSSIPHLTDAVETLLRAGDDPLPRAARQRLALFVVGVLLVGTVVLRRVATTRTSIARGAAQAASHERRLRRIVNDPQLGAAAPMSGRVVRRVLQRVRPDQRVWLIGDASGRSDGVRTLGAALGDRDRALPWAWVRWPAQQPQPQAYSTDCQTLRAQAAAILPAGPSGTALADRAFGCPAVTDLAAAHGWQDLVRARRQTCLRHDDGRMQAVSTLIPPAGTRWCGRGQAFKKQGWRPVSVAASWRVGGPAPLLLVRKLPPAGDLARPYRRRAAIAAVCRDRTTSGWHWEASQVRDVAHQSALVLALALATLLTRCLGEEAARTILNPPPRAGRRRPRHARDRLFRVGRDRLWQRLWQDEPPAITWELVHVDAPNWSTACWQSARPAATPVHRTGRVGKRARLRVAAEGNSMHMTRLFCPPLPAPPAALLRPFASAARPGAALLRPYYYAPPRAPRSAAAPLRLCCPSGHSAAAPLLRSSAAALPYPRRPSQSSGAQTAGIHISNLNAGSARYVASRMPFRSRCERIGCVTGQSTPISGSFQAITPSAEGV
jgi:hypothetical protein